MGRLPTRNRIPPDHNDRSTWLWPVEVARQLGTAVQTVHVYTKKNLLKPYIDEAGAHRYDPDEVYQLKYRLRLANGKGDRMNSRAKLQKNIILALKEGLSIPDAAVQCGATLADVRECDEAMRYTPQQLEDKKRVDELRVQLEIDERERKEKRAAGLQRLREMILTPGATCSRSNGSGNGSGATNGKDGEKPHDRKRRKRRKRSQ